MTDNNNKTFYITTTLPYVNGKPHIGHAMEFVRADVLARHKRTFLGDENVFFNTGTDEHGQKIFDEAFAMEMTPKEYTDVMSENFKDLTAKLNISYDNFIRTTDDYHIAAAQKFWTIVDKNGFIEKRKYQVKYCVGCEMEKTDSELVDGFCPDHPGKKLENIDEENYFFKASEFTKKLEEYLSGNSVIPEFRKNEIQSLISKSGMKDFSISRLKSKMEWGVAVPGDESQVMYVWFDALVDYISTLGWGSADESNFEKFWSDKNSTVFQIAGKDNLRPQSAMWQTMLMAAGIKNSDIIYINGHVTADGGVKMSKSIGNVIDPLEVINVYGVDAFRYFVIRHLSNHEDSPWTEKRFHENYQADLVNGLGNLTNRILAMSEKAGVKLFDEGRGYPVFGREHSKLENYDFNGETLDIWNSIGDLDELITRTKPFALAKSGDPEDVKKLKVVLLSLLNGLWAVADWVSPIIPDTSEKIKAAIDKNEKPKEPLFPRIELEETKKEIDITFSVSSAMEAKGIHARAAICSVPVNSKGRNKKIKDQVKKTLSEINFDELLESSIIKEYKNFYTGFDNLEKRIPPAEHLASIVKESGSLPNINRVVDCYNVVSLKSMLSFGAHDVSGIKGDVCIKEVEGNEKYTPLGAVNPVKVNKGEYAAMDDEKIICRMDIKQCDETKVTERTKDFLIYVQGNKEVSSEALMESLKEFCVSLEDFCGGKYRILE